MGYLFMATLAKYIHCSLPWTRAVSLQLPLLKIRDTKGPFNAKMSLIKDRNGMDLTEAKDIKILRRGGKDTQKNYTKNIFMTQIITMV